MARYTQKKFLSQHRHIASPGYCISKKPPPVNFKKRVCYNSSSNIEQAEYGIEIGPLRNNHFSKDTYTDADTVSLMRTGILIRAMSQNVELPKRIKEKEKTDVVLLVSIIAYVAIQNSIDTAKTIAKYTGEKIEQAHLTFRETNSSGLVSTSYPAPGFRVPTVVFMNNSKPLRLTKCRLSYKALQSILSHFIEKTCTSTHPFKAMNRCVLKEMQET